MKAEEWVAKIMSKVRMHGTRSQYWLGLKELADMVAERKGDVTTSWIDDELRRCNMHKNSYWNGVRDGLEDLKESV